MIEPNSEAQSPSAPFNQRVAELRAKSLFTLKNQWRTIAAILVFTVLGLTLQTLSSPSSTLNSYALSKWFTGTDAWLSPIERGAQDKRFTIWGEVTGLVWVKDQWLAVTSFGQIVSSDDGGFWRELAQLRGSLTGIAVDAESNRVIATTNHGLYLSNDNYDYWEHMSVDSPIEMVDLVDIAFGEGQWVVITASQIMTSTDSWTWQLSDLTSLLTESAAEQIIAPAAPQLTLLSTQQTVEQTSKEAFVKEQPPVTNEVVTVPTQTTPAVISSPFTSLRYSPLVLDDSSRFPFIVWTEDEYITSLDAVRWVGPQKAPYPFLNREFSSSQTMAINFAQPLTITGKNQGRLEIVGAPNLPPLEALSELAYGNDYWLGFSREAIYLSDEGLLWQQPSNSPQFAFDNTIENYQLANEQYQQFSPPLSLLFYAFSGLAFLRSFLEALLKRRKPELVLTKSTAVKPATNSIKDDDASNDFNSDKPITTVAGDLLERKPIALALSQFIRNRSQSKPFTLGISGDWGSGKSSLMYMIVDNLKKTGFSPVWFNGWHHQDSNLLSGLVLALQQQGLPKIWQLRGMAFRSLLLLKRLQFSYLVVFAALIWSCIYLSQKPFVIERLVDTRLDEPFYFDRQFYLESTEGIQFSGNMTHCRWQDFKGRTFAQRSDLFDPIELTGESFLLPQTCQDYLRYQFKLELGSGFTLLYFAASSYMLPAFIFVTGFIAALTNLLGTFGFSFKGRSHVKAAAANDPSAMAVVKQRLRDINWALKWSGNHSLVFFIDDLDRMDKEKLHELMEVLNMLASDNREAFFVLGMDYQRVVNHLNQQLAQVHGSNVSAPLYLHKMVNVVFTPQAVKDYKQLIDKNNKRDEPTHVQQRVTENAKQHFIMHLSVNWADKFLGAAAWALTAVILMSTLLNHKNLPYQPLPLPAIAAGTESEISNLSEITVEAEAAQSTGQATGQTTAQTTTEDPSTGAEQQSFIEVTGSRYVNSTTVSIALVLLAIALLIMISLDRRKQPDDSIHFKEVLRAFAGSLAGLTNTPRQAKRASNLMRMLTLYRTSLGENLEDEFEITALTLMVELYILRSLGLIEPVQQIEFMAQVEAPGFSVSDETAMKNLINYLIDHANYADKTKYSDDIAAALPRFIEEYIAWIHGHKQAAKLSTDAETLQTLNDLLSAFK